jgi:methionine-rich copper-binding protein CopC
MPHPPVSAVRRAARALPVALVLVIVALAGATPAWADGSAGGAAAPTVHHVLPENGAVLRTAPDHVEVMVDVDLVPGQVDVAVAPDATGQLVELPGPPVLDGPLLVQPLPPLPPGRYTVGLQIRGAGGQVARGTFGFAVDPSAPADAALPNGAPDGGGPAAWLLPVAATALLVPAGALVVARRLRRRRPAPGGAPAGPGRAAGRTPTSTSSPAARRGR